MTILKKNRAGVGAEKVYVVEISQGRGQGWDSNLRRPYDCSVHYNHLATPATKNKATKL